jgi:oxygen-independent coproporphyrinogen-3 oxidase
MQSASPAVLATLDRVHTPGAAERAVGLARAAGFEHVSLDLIFGTPGETDADWRDTLQAAVAAGPDHVSTYALTVEPGTALAARVRRGELPLPDDDVQAERYELADALLGGAGLTWYEVASFAASEAARCRHNVHYWRSADWWGIGPGAHSHVGGVRWWNVLHPTGYARRLAPGPPPRPGASCWTRTPAASSGSCSRSGWPRAWTSPSSRPRGAGRPSSSRPRACSSSPPGAPA